MSFYHNSVPITILGYIQIIYLIFILLTYTLICLVNVLLFYFSFSFSLNGIYKPIKLLL
jgi:hypothetical protein